MPTAHATRFVIRYTLRYVATRSQPLTSGQPPLRSTRAKPPQELRTCDNEVVAQLATGCLANSRRCLLFALEEQRTPATPRVPPPEAPPVELA